MSDESVLDGVTPPLTAPDMLDFAAVADLMSDITGCPVTRVVADDADWTAAAVERGMPPAAADFSLGMFRAARRNEFAVTDPTLGSILGHPLHVGAHPPREPRGATTAGRRSEVGSAREKGLVLGGDAGQRRCVTQLIEQR